MNAIASATRSFSKRPHSYRGAVAERGVSFQLAIMLRNLPAATYQRQPTSGSSACRIESMLELGYSSRIEGPVD